MSTLSWVLLICMTLTAIAGTVESSWAVYPSEPLWQRWLLRVNLGLAAASVWPLWWLWIAQEKRR